MNEMSNISKTTTPKKSKELAIKIILLNFALTFNAIIKRSIEKTTAVKPYETPTVVYKSSREGIVN